MFYSPVFKNQVAPYHLDSIDFDIPAVKNLLQFRPATLKLSVIASTVTGFSSLRINYGYGKGSDGVVINEPRLIDTTITFKTARDIWTFIQVDAIGNGVNVEKFDIIFISVNTTRQIENRLRFFASYFPPTNAYTPVKYFDRVLLKTVDLEIMR